MDDFFSPRKGRGLAKKTLDLIEAAREILEEQQPNTVRGVCYQLFVRKLIPDMSKASTGMISRALTNAREQDLTPWEWIVDETREAERVSSWGGLADYGETILRAYRRDFWEKQEYRVEVISEKGTVRGVLAPVLKEFAVTFRVFHGFGSATSVHDLAEESLETDQPMILLYVGDYDPSGMHMSEIDLPERIERYEGDASLERIALTSADCNGALPSFSVEEKRKDPRHDWFVQNHGRRCWEIDAMNPNVLRERVRGAIKDYIDQEAWDHCKMVEAAERESIKSYFDKWPK